MKRASFAALALVLVASSASAITRDEVIVRAKAFSFHPWKAAPANLTASCNSKYKSIYQVGDHLGLPYDWGGYMSLFEFDQQVAQGLGVGSYPEDGVLACTAGLDCSGFVSQAWGTGHYTTSNLAETSAQIAQNTMKPGDVFNKAGFHVAMYSHTLANGDPVLYEAVGYNTHLSMPGWSWVQGYVPRKYNAISGDGGGSPVGTPDNPIAVSSFPFMDARDTTKSLSDVLDGCAAAPSKKESGAEYIYKVVLTKPGTLTASLQDDVNTDIDIHLYGSMNTNDCSVRGDNTFSAQVGCGTYYVVADTFKGTKEYPGPYSIVIDFKASGATCQGGPPVYNFKGGLTTPCAYPGNENLPFCNPNLGAQTCIYTANSSFCSKPCAVNADCPEFAGGCCGTVAKGEHYCMPAAFCGMGASSSTGMSGEDPPPGDPNGSTTTSATSGATTASGGPITGAGGATGATSGAGAANGNGETSEGGEITETTSCSAAQGRSDNGWLAFAALGAAALGRRRAYRRR
jgi:hypothetical protein